TCRCCASASSAGPTRSGRTSAPCSRTCVTPAPSSRTRTSSCSCTGTTTTRKTQRRKTSPSASWPKTATVRRGRCLCAGCRSTPPSPPWRRATTRNRRRDIGEENNGCIVSDRRRGVVGGTGLLWLADLVLPAAADSRQPRDHLGGVSADSAAGAAGVGPVPWHVPGGFRRCVRGLAGCQRLHLLSVELQVQRLGRRGEKEEKGGAGGVLSSGR